MEYLIICIFLGILLTGISAPIMMFINKNKLKEMDKKIEEFESRTFSTEEEKEREMYLLKKELMKMKKDIQIDKKAIEEARDKIELVK